MASADALRVFLSSLERKSYYDILRVGRDADAGTVKSAFHDFSLMYHPDRYVGSPPEVAGLAWRCSSAASSRTGACRAR